VCKKQNDTTLSTTKRYHRVDEKTYAQFDEHFKNLGSLGEGGQPQGIVDFPQPFQGVYRVDFPRGFPLADRKELMYIMYLKYLKSVCTYIKGDIDENQTHLSAFQFTPLLELTVGKTLLRQSVSVMSRRQSLQPTCGIFAWSSWKSNNLDDVHQGAGRINGKRKDTPHLKACFPGVKQVKERRPTLYIAENYFSMITEFGEAIHSKRAVYNLHSPGTIARDLGGELSALKNSHLTKADVIREFTSKYFQKGGNEYLVSDPEVSGSDSEHGVAGYREGSQITDENIDKWIDKYIVDTQKQSVRTDLESLMNEIEEEGIKLRRVYDVAVMLASENWRAQEAEKKLALKSQPRKRYFGSEETALEALNLWIEKVKPEEDMITEVKVHLEESSTTVLPKRESGNSWKSFHEFLDGLVSVIAEPRKNTRRLSAITEEDEGDHAAKRIRMHSN
jgi:hypothetical protein